MPLDEEVVFAIAALDDIRAILVQLPHSEHKAITDKILAFRDSLIKPVIEDDEVEGYKSISVGSMEQDVCKQCAFAKPNNHCTKPDLACTTLDRKDNRNIIFVKE